MQAHAACRRMQPRIAPHPRLERSRLLLLLLLVLVVVVVVVVLLLLLHPHRDHEGARTGSRGGYGMGVASLEPIHSAKASQSCPGPGQPSREWAR